MAACTVDTCFTKKEKKRKSGKKNQDLVVSETVLVENLEIFRRDLIRLCDVTDLDA